MLPNKLPSTLLPVKLCRAAPPEGTQIQGEILLGNITNLKEELKGQKSTPVMVSLIFLRDEQGYCCIKGEFKVNLSFTCQRCMQPMNYVLEEAILVSPVASDTEAKQLPDRYEPLLMENGQVVVAEWIAEELHLALPLVPRHEEPACESSKISDKK